MDVKEELNKKPKDEDTDVLETVLFHVGEMGRYQKWLFVSMMPFGFMFAFVYFGQMFVTATPQRHWCKVPELQHLPIELRRNLSAPQLSNGDWEHCLTYKTNWSQVLETMSTPDPHTPTIPCRHGWEFELGDIPYHTVVSERGWVCENSGLVPLAQSIFFSGSFVAGLAFGWMADRFGRIPALIGSNLMGCIGGIASIFTTGFWDFAFCRFLVGMAHDSCFMMLYILVLEYVGPKHRTWVANMSIAAFYGTGCLVLPWLAVWIADWRNLLLATSLPMLIVIGTPFVVPESARWLVSRGRVAKAVKLLRKMERVNGTKIPQEIIEEFVISSRRTKDTDESLLALFKSSHLRIMMLLTVVVYMANALIFDGLVRMSEDLGLDFFITFTMTSAMEIPSITLLALVLDKWGRRMLTCGPMCLVGVLSLIAAFVPKGVPQVSLAIACRFLISMTFNVILQWATELLPTAVRASGTSVVHGTGYVATFISPFVVYSERFWRPLPLFILGVVGLVAGGASVLLPETNGRPMPQTIADGEKLVKEHSLYRKATDEENSR